MPDRPTIRTAVDEQEKVEILGPAFADPTSKGELTAPIRGGAVADAPAGRQVGRTVTRERLRGVVLDEQAANIAADLTAGLAGLQDEISNEEALRNAGALDGAHGFDVPGAVEEVPPEPQTLPAVIGRTVFRPDPNVERTPVVPEWHSVKSLPGYLQSPIRAFGRFIFRGFPCFEAHERRARAAGADPLGEIGVLANLGGRGPSRQSEIDVMANWIRGNGLAVDASDLEFPAQMPGYRPQVVIAATQDETFLLVTERAANGAPTDALYIYRWHGGRGVYLNNAQARGRLADMAVKVLPPAQPRQQAAGRPAVPADVPRSPQIQKVPRPKPASLVAAAPAAVRSPLVSALREAGFVPFGTPQGPALRLRTESGSVIVRGERGRPLHGSESLTMQVLGEDGAVREEREIASAEDAVAALTSPPRP